MRLPDSRLLARRHGGVLAALETLGLDALIVTSPVNIRYLTNHIGSAGVLVATPGAFHLLVDFRYEEAVRAMQATTAACPALQLWSVPGSYDDALAGCLAEIGVRAVGFEAAHLAVARYERLCRAIETRGLKVALHPTERIVEQIRMVKDEFEITLLRDAAARLGPVAEAARAAVRAGVAERDLARQIEAALRDAGYERPAFDTIVASGPHSAWPHYRAGDRLLARGDLVVLDFGGVLDGYCSDLTRTVTVGPAGPEAQRLHAAVREAQRAAIAAVRPGVATTSVDAAARQVLEGYGLGSAFGHGTGHGLGLDVHEEPRISRPRPDIPDPDVTLRPGMVFTIEPGVYLAGQGGVRIEDDVLVTPSGCEVLTRATDELIC
jgi:Xaa-Pro aminopeptidase